MTVSVASTFFSILLFHDKCNLKTRTINVIHFTNDVNPIEIIWPFEFLKFCIRYCGKFAYILDKCDDF